MHDLPFKTQSFSMAKISWLSGMLCGFILYWQSELFIFDALYVTALYSSSLGSCSSVFFIWASCRSKSSAGACSGSTSNRRRLSDFFSFLLRSKLNETRAFQTGKVKGNHKPRCLEHAKNKVWVHPVTLNVSTRRCDTLDCIFIYYTILWCTTPNTYLLSLSLLVSYRNIQHPGSNDMDQ